MRIIKLGSRALYLFILLVSASVNAQTNLAIGASVTGSTNIQPASLAIDGNTTTRWESAHGVDPSSLTVDLGSAKSLSSVQVVWEAANAANYLIMGSNDNVNWATLKIFTGGTFGARTDTSTISGTYRYVRMHGTARSSGNTWGYSIYEFRIFGATASSSVASSVTGNCNLGCVTTLNSNTMRATVTQGQVVDIHYKVNNGAQQNVAMTLSGGVWSYNIGNLPAGAVVSVSFTIINNGAGQDTPWQNYTLGTTPSSSSSSSVAPSSSSSSVVANGLVRIYEHCNYGGWVANFNTGSFNAASIVSAGGTDNGASSIRVAAGYKATLYPNNDYTGTPVVITGDNSCLVGLSFNDVMSSMVVSLNTSSSSSVSSSASSVSSSTASLGNIVPLYNSSTVLEGAIQFDRGDALVTRIADRGRDRHAKESQFQAYDHFLSFYWEHRTATIEIEDYVAKGGNKIRMNVVTQFRLNDTEAENRWFYRGVGTVAEFCDNEKMTVVND
ncbi:MAG: discoidin domain-containing protein, partial [Sphingobacteriales bacterium]